MTLHYLHLVGEAGRTRLSKLVMHIPFADPTTKEKSKEDDQIEENETTAHDVIKACYDYGLQQEAEAICRVRITFTIEMYFSYRTWLADRESRRS